MLLPHIGIGFSPSYIMRLPPPYKFGSRFLPPLEQNPEINPECNDGTIDRGTISCVVCMY